MAKTKKGGPIETERKKEIFDQLKEIIESGQILGVTNTQLAHKLNVSRVTLPKYLKEVYEAIPDEDIKIIQVKIDTIFQKLFREAQKLINSAQSDKEKREAMEFLLRCIKEFTDFLERFGLKARAVENYAIKAEVDINLTKNEVENLSKEILEDI